MGPIEKEYDAGELDVFEIEYDYERSDLSGERVHD